MKVAVFTLADNKPKISRQGHRIDVFSWKTPSVSAVNLRDYDGIIFDVDCLAKSKEDIDLSTFEYETLNPEIIFDVLSTSNSFIAVIGNPYHELYNNPIIRRFGFELQSINGSGSSLYVSKKSNNPKWPELVKYAEKINTYEYAFKADGVSITSELADISGANIRGKSSTVLFNGLLKTRADHIVGGTLILLTYDEDRYGKTSNVQRFREGSLLLLPPLHSGGRESIEAILDLYCGSKGDETDMEPDWTEEFSVFGQEEIDNALSKNKESINQLSIEADNLYASRSELRRSLEILYKADKPLEKSIKWYLSKVGITVTEPEVDNEAEFYFEANGKKFVAEVKSTAKDSIDKKGLRQVTEWQDEKFIETGEEYKPILIVSVEYDKSPQERTSNFLPDNLQAFAKKKGIAVISVQYLFDELQKVEARAITLNQFIDKLFKLSGTVSG